MIVQRQQIEAFSETEDMLSQVADTRLLTGRERAYEGADISLREFSPLDLYPTALYVMKPNLEVIRRLREYIKQSTGEDILHLRGILEHDDGIIAPPIVELSDGVPAIVDGIHRIYHALHSGETVNCIYIEGASAPIISVPVEWGYVESYDVKPENPRQLRIIREGIADDSNDLRRFYRDFSYLGSKGRRPRQGQEG